MRRLSGNGFLARIFRAHYPLSKTEMATAIACLILAAYALTPRYWEPTGESWKQWAAARILRETGGFPVFSLGPLYVTYLQLFLPLDYPWSIRLEYLATHLFCYASIFLLLRGFLASVPAVWLTLAWIPALAVLESNGLVAGIGFLALYFRQGHSVLNRGYFPPTLAAAALCHSAYVAFFVGHVLGVLIERFRASHTTLYVSSGRNQAGKLILLLNGGMALLVLLTFLSPSHRSDHNHMLADPTYAPIPLKDPLTIGFFQIGNWKYVKRTEPESSWIYQDWYLTNGKAFNGATTIAQAVVSKPETVLQNLLENLRPAANVPMNFLGGPPLAEFGSWLLGVGSWMVFLIGCVGIVNSYERERLLPCVCSIAVGTGAVMVALWLTWFNRRYVMTLLPVSLLAVVHIGPGLHELGKSLLEQRAGRYPWPNVLSRWKGQHISMVVGLLLILTGLACNEWVLARWFSSDGVLTASTRLAIWFFDGLLIASGGVLVHFRGALSTVILSKVSWYTGAIVLLSATSVLLLSGFPHGKMAQVEAVMSHRGFLSGSEPVSMVAAHRQLTASLNEKTRVLAWEDTWFKAFANIDLNQVYGVFSLPPCADPTGKTDQMLESLDVIGVSTSWTEAVPSVGTQEFLRYRLHVEPFLEKAVARGWTVEGIKGYGRLYRRPISDQQKRGTVALPACAA